MKNKQIKIIFTDIDWTLFDHHSLKYPRSGLRALNKARKNGYKIIICSARCYKSFSAVKALEKIPHDGYICSGGGIAYVEGKYLYREAINPDIVKQFVERADKLGYELQLIGPTYSFLTLPENDLASGYYKYWLEYHPPVKKYEGEEVTSILLFCLHGQEKDFKDFPLYFYRFYDSGVDVTEKPYLKSTGIRAVLDYYGYDKSQALAIGDDIPDVEMFNEVGTSIAMGNGKEECKQHASYITDNIEKHGLKKALKHYKII